MFASWGVFGQKLKHCSNQWPGVVYKEVYNTWRDKGYFQSWTQKKIFWRMLVTQQFLLAIECFLPPHTIEVNGYCQSATVWLPTFFKITFFFFNKRKKFIYCNNLRMSKWWQNLFFLVNYPFKSLFWNKPDDLQYKSENVNCSKCNLVQCCIFVLVFFHKLNKIVC